MRLLLLRPGAELDHGGSSIGERQQDMFPVGPRHRHLGLRGEDQIITELRCGRACRCMGRQEGQCGQPELESWRMPGPDLSEFRDFALAVQQKQVARRPGGHSAPSGRHADSRETGDQHGSRAAPEHPLCRQGGDYRPGTGQQNYVRTLASDPAYDGGVREHVDSSSAGCPNLGCRRHDRVLDQQLRGFARAGQGVQCRRAPLQVGVTVGDGEHAHCRVHGRRCVSEHRRFAGS